MVSIKEAVASAVAFAQDLFGADQASGIRLEEDGNPDSWLITLSMRGPSDFVSAALTGRRDYKIFTVRKDTGDVTSVKIRELANA